MIIISKSGAVFGLLLTGETARAEVNMKNGITDNFLTAAICTAVFSLLLMAGSMVHAIIAEFDNATDITPTAENNRSAEQATEATELDHDVLSVPAAGMAGKGGTIAYDCKDMSYQTTGNGIRYVRELGGVYNAAIINGQFGLYKLGYGYLQPVDNSVLDPESIRKLRYTLANCKEFYIRSGVQMLTAVSSSGPRG
jgi:hypothetical protein